jgi:hypothetical protein
MLLFIAGPMSGYEEWNFPAFYAAEESFRALGYEVCNPARLFTDMIDVPSWEDCMRITIPELMKCDGIVLLDGWKKSQGASMELFLAQKIKIKVYGGFSGMDITDIVPVLTLEGVKR